MIQPADVDMRIRQMGALGGVKNGELLLSESVVRYVRLQVSGRNGS